jgi:hypothetical protein
MGIFWGCSIEKREWLKAPPGYTLQEPLIPLELSPKLCSGVSSCSLGATIGYTLRVPSMGATIGYTLRVPSMGLLRYSSGTDNVEVSTPHASIGVPAYILTVLLLPLANSGGGG